MFKIISCECAGGAFSDFTVEGDPTPPLPTPLYYAEVERYEKYLLFENLTQLKSTSTHPTPLCSSGTL